MTEIPTLTAPVRAPVVNLTPTDQFRNTTAGYPSFTHDSHFMSHDNRRIDYHWTWVYGWDHVQRALTGDEFIVLVRLDQCPATAECTDGHHHLILHARCFEGEYFIRDLNTLILHDMNMTRVDAIAAGNNLATAVHNTLVNNLTSMQNSRMLMPEGSNHGLVVYNDSAETLMRRLPTGDGYGLVVAVPSSRWLVGQGEAQRYRADSYTWLTFTPESDANLRSMWGDSFDSANPTVEATVEPPPTTVEVQPALIEQLERTVAMRDRTIENLNDTIRHAKNVAQRYTLDNGGCDAGKRQFLNDLGLHDEDEIDEMFEQDFIVHIDVPITATVSTAITVRASSMEQASDMVVENLSDYTTTGQILLDFNPDSYNTNVEWSEVEVTSTDYA